jgi:hypothetical protein
MSRWIRGELALGFILATCVWIVLVGWLESYTPTEAEKNKCYEQAHQSGHKSEECKTLWERTTTDPVALFTFVLAVSTVGLWIATIALYRAGEKQLRHLEGTSRRQLRAYVYVEDVSILYANSEWNPNFRIKIQNFGQTPAYEVKNNCSTSLVIAGKPDLGPSKQEMRRADLGPNQHKMTTMVVAHEMWEKILKPAIIKRAGTFYVFGEITYFDAFQDRSCDVPHFTRYRFEISPDDEGITDGGLYFSIEGNESN